MRVPISEVPNSEGFGLARVRISEVLNSEGSD